MRSTRAHLVIAIALMIGLSGCTASERSSQADVDSAQRSGSVTSDVTTAPGTAADEFVGAIADIEIDTCKADKSQTVFAGSVTNPEKTAVDYRVYVSVLHADTTLGVQEIDVPNVAGGASVEWSGELKVGAADASCVLRVERVSAK